MVKISWLDLNILFKSENIMSTVKTFLCEFKGMLVPRLLIKGLIEYGIIGEGSQILTNHKRENSVFSILIGRNLRPFPDNTVLYH